MKEIRILGIYVNRSKDDTQRIQEILTRYGCSIRTRLGLHDTDEEYYDDRGLILLELYGNDEEAVRLENELLEIDYVEVQKMTFQKK
ncbi:MAG TPA: hypothetical protein PLJ84_04870 [Bacteroidales bacterium]|nr:hypothetical protein [Bacteroidales bacterium]HPT01910.1 hypothetical protein [Bacteroidales bacterium]